MMMTIATPITAVQLLRGTPTVTAEVAVTIAPIIQKTRAHRLAVVNAKTRIPADWVAFLVRSELLV
jgi:hypothetical protein